MSNIPQAWVVSWVKCCHMPYVDATRWVLEWYQQEQIKVILEMAQSKEKIKQCRINYDVNSIDIYEPMSRLREGTGSDDDWASFRRLELDIEDNVYKIQNELHAVDRCRRHLEFLKYTIKEAKKDYEEAIELAKQDNNTPKKEKEKPNGLNDNTSPTEKQDNDTSSL